MPMLKKTNSFNFLFHCRPHHLPPKKTHTLKSFKSTGNTLESLLPYCKIEIKYTRHKFQHIIFQRIYWNLGIKNVFLLFFVLQLKRTKNLNKSETHSKAKDLCTSLINGNCIIQWQTI